MPRGLDDFADDLRRMSLLAAGGEGPGAYHRLVERLRTILREEGPSAPALAVARSAWAERDFEAWYARPLLLLASLRFIALDDSDHTLAPEVLMDAEADDLADRFEVALADPRLVEPLTQRSVQTNEPGRAIGWVMGVLALRLGHRAFDLVDLGCSAGLNLVADLCPQGWRVGSRQFAGLDVASPHTRLGLDVAPVDLDDPESMRWLRACIWAGASERRQRFEAAVSGRKRLEQAGQAPIVRVHDLGRDATRALLEAELAPGDRPALAFESVVSPYLSEAALAHHEAELRAWLEGDRRRVWLRLDPAAAAGLGGPMALEGFMANDAGAIERLELGRCGYHPTGFVPAPAGLERLSALWERAA